MHTFGSPADPRRNFITNEIESHSGFRVQPHLRRARRPPICHFNSHLAHVRLFYATHCPNGLPRHFSKQQTKLVGGCLPRLTVGCVFPCHIWHKTYFFIDLCEKSFAAYQQSKMADERGAPDRRSPHHVTGHLRRKRSSSSQVTLALEDDWSTRQQQNSEAATSSKTSKATDDRPSRSHAKKSNKIDSSSVSVVDRSSQSDGPSSPPPPPPAPPPPQVLALFILCYGWP